VSAASRRSSVATRLPECGRAGRVPRDVASEDPLHLIHRPPQAIRLVPIQHDLLQVGPAPGCSRLTITSLGSTGRERRPAQIATRQSNEYLPGTVSNGVSNKAS
jgi:hypothetical protein